MHPPSTPNTAPAPATTELQPGATLSHYQIVERMERGGMGTVYRARDARLGRDVAIKVINAEIAADADRIARFRREATMVAALNHPAIVVIHDTGSESGVSYLVTELVDGASLRSVLQHEGALGYRRAIDIGAQIADALGAAHALGITHRDVKPENVMLTRQGRVKLLDFGLAKSLEVESDHAATRTALHTQEGVVLGTVGYMSPEQVRGETLDARSDVFSLGIVLFEMLSAARPFEGRTTADAMSAVLRAEPPPLPDSVPAGLRTIVGHCLASQPSERFQSASDLAFALRSLAGSTSAVPAVAARPATGSRFWLAATAVAVTGGLAALVLYQASSASADGGTVQVRPSATEAHGEAMPIWSPDARNIAYVAAIDGRDNIFVKGVATPGADRVLQCPALCDTVGWSANGRILYHSRTTHLDARLWSVAPAGGAPTLVFKDDVQVLASALSGDGKRLAMLRVMPNPDGPGGRYGLFLSEPPGAPPVRVESFPLFGLIQPTRIAWAADSDRLLVVTAGPRQINLVSLRDQSIKQFPLDGPADVSWSLDPRFAVVARPAWATNRSGLEWLDTETGRLSPLLSSENVLSHPSVSPDGSRVAYTVGESDYDLVEIPVDGSPIHPLLASRLPEHSVHYSPRSPDFAYVAAGEEAEIRIRQAATLAERVVVSRADFPGEPDTSRFSAVAFSPDGSKLAYNRNFTIWISPSNGGAPTTLTKESGEFGPEWSPDGAWIAYSYARPHGGLVKVRVGAGEPEVRLRPGVCGPAAPAWSPDGAWIACGREPMGLDIVPAGGGAPHLLGLQYEPVAAWSRDSNTLFVIRLSEGRRELGQLNWRTGTFRFISRIPSDFLISNAMSWAGRLSLSHDGKSLVTAVSRATGDIWILDGLRPPQTWWTRLTGRR